MWGEFELWVVVLECLGEFPEGVDGFVSVGGVGVVFWFLEDL